MKPYVIIFGLASSLLVTLAQGAESRQYVRFEGLLSEDRMGVAVGTLGDVNKDGYTDILVGARYADVGTLADAGSVSVFSGVDGSELIHLNGAGAGDWFGVAVAGTGDVNGDGTPDFIIGAQFAKRDNGQQPGAGQQTGAAYIYSGANGAQIYRLFGDASDGRFGVSVAGGSDIDGDGKPDFVVGAYTGGAAYVYSGATGQLIAKLTGTGNTWYGFAVAMLPDVNGDGRGEIAVAAPQDGAGSVRVYSGATRALLYTLKGENSGDWFGFAVAAAGDLNGDQKSELLIGAREASPSGHTNAGSAYVYEGKNGTLLRRLDGTNDRDAFGTSVSAAGDINRDGTNDILVGARFALNSSNQPTGAALVYSGADGSQITKVNGELSQDWFGGSVAVVGDINGDGWLEWVVGAAGSDPGGRSNAGQAYVFGMKHFDLAVTSISAPQSARLGDTLTISYSVVNHGEPGLSTYALSVNGVRKTSASSTLDFMSSRSSSFSYTLKSGDFFGGRSTICINAAGDGVTDGYSADNAKCAQISQTL